MDVKYGRWVAEENKEVFVLLWPLCWWFHPQLHSLTCRGIFDCMIYEAYAAIIIAAVFLLSELHWVGRSLTCT